MCLGLNDTKKIFLEIFFVMASPARIFSTGFAMHEFFIGNFPTPFLQKVMVHPLGVKDNVSHKLSMFDY